MDKEQQPGKFQVMLSSFGSIVVSWFTIMLLPLIFTYLFGEFVMPSKVSGF
jgi:hypothetical protein